MLKAPRCYGGCGKPARWGQLFCTDKCAAEWAEELARGNEDHWCAVCEQWGHPQSDGRLQCNHPDTGIKEGMRVADMKKVLEKCDA